MACFQDGHSTWQAAGLCRMDAAPAKTETVLAVAELRNRLPASFVTGTAPAPRTGDAGGGTGGAATGPSPASWPAPSETALSSPSAWISSSQAAGPSPTSWAPPSEAAAPSHVPWPPPYEAGQASEAPGHTAPYHATPVPHTAPSAPAPSSGNTGADERDDDPWEAALRRELAALSAAMPALDPLPLAAEAARAGRRHGTRRRALVTGMSVTLTALVVVPLAFAAAGLAERATRGAGDARGAPASPDVSATIPGPLPASLPDPVRFAYRGFCTRDDWDPVAEEYADNGCDQWRLVTATGEQWRVPDVTRDLGDGWNPLLAISGDGNRMAYYSETSSDFMVLDRRRARAERSGMLPLGGDASPEDTHLVISPGGRWMAADFGSAAQAPSPRVQSLTSYRVSTLPRRMRILAVGDDGTVTGTATWDTDVAPGRLTTTVLLRVRPDGRTLSRTPIDPALFESGVAVSPDGHALAVAGERAHPREDDHGLLATLDTATGRVLTRREAALPADAHVAAVRGWASEHEVIVEAERAGDDEDEGEEYSVHAVDVRTGAARPIALDEAGGVPALWVPGALR